MKTITITRTDEELKIEALAEVKWYKSSTFEDVTTEMEVKTARAENFRIEEVLEDETMCLAITGQTEVANTQSAAEFVWEFYQKMIDNDMANEYKRINKRELEETRRLEDEAIDKAVEEAVEWGTKIIVE